MIESPQQNEQDLWAQYQAIKAAKMAAITLLTALMGAQTTLLSGNTPDFVTVNGSADGGGDESYTQVSINAKIQTVTATVASLQAQERAALLLARENQPGINVRPIGHRCGRNWG